MAKKKRKKAPWSAAKKASYARAKRRLIDVFSSKKTGGKVTISYK